MAAVRSRITAEGVGFAQKALIKTCQLGTHAKEHECSILQSQLPEFIYHISGGCASTVKVIQQGESPCPTKRSEQSVLNLGAETVR